MQIRDLRQARRSANDPFLSRCLQQRPQQLRVRSYLNTTPRRTCLDLSVSFSLLNGPIVRDAQPVKLMLVAGVRVLRRIMVVNIRNGVRPWLHRGGMVMPRVGMAQFADQHGDTETRNQRQ